MSSNECCEIIFSDEGEDKAEEQEVYNHVYSSLSEVSNCLTGWEEFFTKKEVEKELLNISNGLKFIKANNVVIFPPIELIFKAFELTSPNDIRAVIVGQDCYHDKGSAMGLCFSIFPGRKINPSMRNIQKVVQNSGFKINSNTGDLTKWAKQGVFLINTALTVEEGKPESHLELWKNFSSLLFKFLIKEDIVWLLFGAKAHKFKDIIKSKYKIKTSHCSPLGAHKGNEVIPAFIKSKCFSRCNELLVKLGKQPLNWDII